MPTPVVVAGRHAAGNDGGFRLQSANSWKDGIRDITLRVYKLSSKELGSLCFAGQRKDPDDLTAENQLNRFHPTDDILVYYDNTQGKMDWR